MWFTETPWPPVVICAVAAAMLFVAYSATGRTGALLGIAVSIAIGGVVLLVERLVVTDAEEIEASVLGITSAFQRGDLEETLDYVSPRAPELQVLITLAMKTADVHDDLRITDLGVEMKSANSRGIARFRANATVSVAGQGNVGYRTSRWETTWQKEGDRWQVIRIQQLDVMTGQPIPNPMLPVQ